MTLEEYKNKVKHLAEMHDLELRHLACDYAKANNPYKVGDIIKDHIGYGRIINILIRPSKFDPMCVYEVDNLTSKGTINKRDPKRKIYQSNIIT